MMDTAYIDTETTGVQHFHELWEVAVVRVSSDGSVSEHITQVRPQNFSQADPFALRIGKYSERFDPQMKEERFVADSVWRLLDGATLAGITVSFDARMIGDWFLRSGLPPFPWHYRLLDVSTYAAGIAASAGMISPGEMPNSDMIFKLFDIEIPDKVRHTALGDARATRELHIKALDLAEELSNR